MHKKMGLNKYSLVLFAILIFFISGCTSFDNLPADPPMPGSSAKAGASPVGRAFIAGEELPGGYANPSRSGFTFLHANTTVEAGRLLLHIDVSRDERYDDTLTYFRMYYFSPSQDIWRECLATSGTRRTRIDGSLSDWFETDTEAACDISNEMGDADYTDASWAGEVTWVLGYQCVRDGIMPWDCPNLWPVQRVRACPVGMIGNDDDSACVPLRVGCVSNDDCPDMNTCVSGQCQQEEPTVCGDTSDCAVGRICQNQLCVMPECTTDTDCTLPERCIGNVCTAPACVPSAEICDQLDNDCDSEVDEDMACDSPGTCVEVNDVGDDSATAGRVISSDDTQVGGTFNIVLDLTVYNDRCLTPAGTLAATGDMLDEYSCNPDNTVGRTRYTCSCETDSVTSLARCTPSCVPSGEICDNVDNDCDGTVDDGCDDDNDNYCELGMTRVATPAVCPLGGYDCNDESPAINLAAVDSCDSVDSDCNGVVDDAASPEVCDGADNDCDGSVDEGGICCSDSDASVIRQVMVVGTITGMTEEGEMVTYADSCSTSDILREGACTDGAIPYVDQTDFLCSWLNAGGSTYICQSGACVVE